MLETQGDGAQSEFGISVQNIPNFFEPYELEPTPHITTHWKYVFKAKLGRIEKWPFQKFYIPSNVNEIKNRMQLGFCWATKFQYFKTW